MTTSNAFKINGTTIPQPTDHSWKDRDAIGTDGNGHLVYVAPREYELKWNLLSDSEFNSIYTFFLSVGITGSAVVDLPQWGVSTYQFRSYSGTVLNEPSYSDYFENFYSDVRLLITKITT